MARYQSTPSRCAPAAISNALQALKIIRSEEEIASLAGTTASGTSSEGILKALKQIAHSTNRPPPGVIYESREDVTALRLVKSLQIGRPIILCVTSEGKPWEHWVSCWAMLGFENPILHIADSAHEERVVHYTLQETIDWMRAPGEKKPFYGIIV